MGEAPSFSIMYLAVAGVVLIAAITAWLLGGFGPAIFAGALALLGERVLRLVS